MAKTMAQITDNLVTNMIWCSDRQAESDTLKDPKDRPVTVGDTYADGKWYRNGVEILTPLEEALKRIEELETANADQAAALLAIYKGATEVSV